MRSNTWLPEPQSRDLAKNLNPYEVRQKIILSVMDFAFRMSDKRDPLSVFKNTATLLISFVSSSKVPRLRLG